ncbi:MAG: hypothetical protein HC880_01355 [Bacteroidia bacterium]|nr:hypothetical protein [Bacteroidia bacterium]
MEDFETNDRYKTLSTSVRSESTAFFWYGWTGDGSLQFCHSNDDDQSAVLKMPVSQSSGAYVWTSLKKTTDQFYLNLAQGGSFLLHYHWDLADSLKIAPGVRPDSSRSIRVLLRDASNRWFASEAVALPFDPWLPQQARFVHLDSLTWSATKWGKMVQGELNLTPDETPPDLAQVTGLGLYLEAAPSSHHR